MEKFEDKCSKVKIIVSEIDGIITEHLSPIDELGNTLFKQYYMKDFEAINELKKAFTFVFLSKDNTINYHLCKKRNIPFFHAPKNKKEKLAEIIRRYGVTAENVLYVGCSYSDIENIKMAEVSVCPDDSVKTVRQIVDCSIPVYGGAGVLCELYEMLKPTIINIKK
jgi:3-deoxy-D-manno-octulosonate 8-phosphate phosphatase (KDO 8-P phosphatase)